MPLVSRHIGAVQDELPSRRRQTTGCFSLRRPSSTLRSILRCACTSSCGVSAIHCASETSMNRGDLNSSRKRTGSLPVRRMGLGSQFADSS